MNRQDQQAIDDLFQHLNQSAAQAGPRDPEAEADGGGLMAAASTTVAAGSTDSFG